VIFLILKMFIYLLLALVAGAGAGWILRHIAASKQDEEMQGTLSDARARVPQFESLIRSRDEQINRLKEDLKEKDVRINGLLGEARDNEKELKEKLREARELAARRQTLKISEGPDASAAAGDISAVDAIVDGVIEESSTEDRSAADVQPLEDQVARLEQELSDARAQAADALAEAAATGAEVVALKAALGRAGKGEGGDQDADDVRELEVRLQQKASEYDRLAAELETEKRRVVELERERELQNKSLQVLHQQLELERERGQRVANG
jgi:chromosome segregation ATPase